MRRLAWFALALLAACGTETKTPPGPLNQIRLPTGMAVHHGRVLVVSSNGDLLYDDATGGSLISLDPVTVDSVGIAAAANVRSFAGELAVARQELPGDAAPDAEACGTSIDAPLAVFGTRGSNLLHVYAVRPTALTCERCDIPVGTGYGDPFTMAIACGNDGRARAFTGYLSAANGAAIVTSLELTAPAPSAPPGVDGQFTVRTASLGVGSVRGFAYDREHDRLFVTGTATASETPLRWFDLAGCTFGVDVGQGGCALGAASLPTASPEGYELRGIALASSRAAGTPRRAYITARLYDLPSAAANGYRTTDFGGRLLVVDLYDDPFAGVDPVIVREVPMGRGAQTVQVLPRLAGSTRRDVVAALAVDDGELLVYDDETGTADYFRSDDTPGGAQTGAPILGHQPFGLAVDPVLTASTARVWVGSYQDSFVTPIDVILDPAVVATFAGGSTGQQHRISGATP